MWRPHKYLHYTQILEWACKIYFLRTLLKPLAEAVSKRFYFLATFAKWWDVLLVLRKVTRERVSLPYWLNQTNFITNKKEVVKMPSHGSQKVYYTSKGKCVCVCVFVLSHEPYITYVGWTRISIFACYGWAKNIGWTLGKSNHRVSTRWHSLRALYWRKK